MPSRLFKYRRASLASKEGAWSKKTTMPVVFYGPHKMFATVFLSRIFELSSVPVCNTASQSYLISNMSGVESREEEACFGENTSHNTTFCFLSFYIFQVLEIIGNPDDDDDMYIPDSFFETSCILEIYHIIIGIASLL